MPVLGGLVGRVLWRHQDSTTRLGTASVSLMEQPETRYAQSGDFNIAYQTIGDGPIDVVFVFGWVSNLNQIWADPASAKFFQRISSYARLILFDKRGTGMSDPVFAPPLLEDRMDDMRAVMDAVGSERAALIGLSEGGPMTVLFAATYPGRVSHLALTGTFARTMKAAGYPFGWDDADYARLFSVVDHWGEGRTTDLFLPEFALDPAVRAAMGTFERTGASPRVARMLVESMSEIDVRDVLPVVHVPTLVHHRQGDQAFSVDGARYLAANIPDSKLMVQQGTSHIPWIGGGREFSDQLETFLTGQAPMSLSDRVLATVLFTDIVDSTATAAESGDEAWVNTLEAHDRITRDEVEAHRGIWVNHTGDGILASFDRPAAAVRSAIAIRDGVRQQGIEVRAGVHTGEVEVRGSNLGGIGVHIGARVAALAGPSQILASRTVKDLVIGSGLEFTDFGTHTLKGVPDQWQIYDVASALVTTSAS